MSSTIDRPRLDKLRKGLASEIPRLPNDRLSKQEIESRTLAQLLIDYVNWRMRFIAARPRAVSIEEAAVNDPRWQKQSPAIQRFLEKVRHGDDVTPYLSTRVYRDGVAPAAGKPTAPARDRWLDKDFVLNTMGFHHFHLKPALGGPNQRADELVFAEVTRDQFVVVALFGHDVFEDTPERMRLYTLEEERRTQGMPPGTVYVSNLIATSGHSIHAVRYAQHCARIIKEYDAKFDDNSYVYKLFQNAQLQRPRRLKLDWRFNHLDLGVYERTSNTFIVLQRGWT